MGADASGVLESEDLCAVNAVKIETSKTEVKNSCVG